MWPAFNCIAKLSGSLICDRAAFESRGIHTRLIVPVRMYVPHELMQMGEAKVGVAEHNMMQARVEQVDSGTGVDRLFLG
jgi:hypothetical protein